MPHKRRDSPFYYVRPRLPGRGRIVALSTGTKDRRQAEGMEAMLRELRPSGYGDVLDAILDGKLRLRDAYLARLAGRLDSVLDDLRDPPISTLWNEIGDGSTLDPNFRGVLPRLKAYAGHTRRSWLTDPANLTAYLGHVVDDLGLAPGTAIVCDLQFVTRLLDRLVGMDRRREIVAVTKKPRVDDRRSVDIPGEVMEAILDGIEHPVVRSVVGFLVLTGVDLGPAMRLTPRHVHGTRLTVPDTKNATRWREIPLSGAAGALVRTSAFGKAPDAPLFPVSRSLVRLRFKESAERAGVGWLRLKDLRHVFAAAFLRGGGTLPELSTVLGHGTAKSTMRYLYLVKLNEARGLDAMQGAANALGLGGAHIRTVDRSVDRQGGVA